ncbi:MAG: BBP7 family outer membrane beta-barrel protein [Planctomycetota bacterium]|nr:BBP7 family outer membrane beta-barrel protein [Planctomycetota bacterium]
MITSRFNPYFLRRNDGVGSTQKENGKPAPTYPLAIGNSLVSNLTACLFAILILVSPVHGQQKTRNKPNADAINASYSSAQIDNDLPAPLAQHSHDFECMQPPDGIASYSQSSLLWVDAEYLLWSISHKSSPELITASPLGTSPNNAGVLGFPNTRSLVDSDFGNSMQSGFKIGVGRWFDSSHELGFEIDYMGLPSQVERNRFTSDQLPILARPVFDSATGQEAASLIAYPNILSGNVTVSAAAEQQFVSGLFRERWMRGPKSQIDVLFGPQYAGLHNTISIDQVSQYLTGQGPILVGTTKQISDHFQARNQFYGGLMGIEYRERIGLSVLSVRPGVAFGMNEAKVNIRGSTTNTVPNAGSAEFEGGLLAQTTNVGTYSDRKLVAIPELTVRLQTQLYTNWQFNVGYNLHYWSNAVRSESQIDRHLSQFPPETPTGDQHPSFPFQKEAVLIHGLQTGLVFRF